MKTHFLCIFSWSAGCHVPIQNTYVSPGHLFLPSTVGRMKKVTLQGGGEEEKEEKAEKRKEKSNEMEKKEKMRKNVDKLDIKQLNVVWFVINYHKKRYI